MAKDFYLTLPSNCALETYPDNSTSHYTTPLHQRIELPCAYEVALVEISFPDMVDNVYEGGNEITIRRVRGEILDQVKVLSKVYYQQSVKHILADGRVISPGHYTNSVTKNRHRRKRSVEQSAKIIPVDSSPPDTDVATYTGAMLFKALEPVERDKFRGKVMETVVKEIVPDYYPHLDLLLLHINSLLPEFVKLKTSGDGHVHVEQKLSYESIQTSVYLSEPLCLQLGFIPGIDILDFKMAPRPYDLSRGIPKQIFVYGDFVQPQMVGDVSAPLLRTVNTQLGRSSAHWGLSTQIFTSPYYLPVSKRCFDTVEINLRDHAGRFIPFTSGTSSVVLHFRAIPAA